MARPETKNPKAAFRLPNEARNFEFQNHIVLVLVLVIEDPKVEDEDQNEDENVCWT